MLLTWPGPGAARPMDAGATDTSGANLSDKVKVQLIENLLCKQTERYLHCDALVRILPWSVAGQ